MRPSRAPTVRSVLGPSARPTTKKAKPPEVAKTWPYPANWEGKSHEKPFNGRWRQNTTCSTAEFGCWRLWIGADAPVAG